jgi:general secretion pathway protein L
LNVRKRIVIRLERGKPYEASWVVNDGHEEGPSMIKTGALSEAAAAGVGARIIVLVPSADLLIASVAIPATQRRRILSAIPYALEDQLAEDVENLHFAVGKRDSQGNVGTVVVSHQVMRAWMDQLLLAGIFPAAVFPDCLCLPQHEAAWTLLLDGDDALLRSGAQGGSSVDVDNLDPVLTLALAGVADETRPSRLVVYDANPEPRALTLDSAGIGFEVIGLHEPAVALLAQHADEASAIDLLQADYSRREQLGKFWRPWRAAAGLLLAWVLVQLGSAGLEYRRLSSELAMLQQQAGELYVNTFPGAKLRGDPRAQMDSRLRELRVGGGGGGDAFVQLLGQVAERLAQTPSLQIDRLNYRGGEINLSFSIGDLQKLDQLKQKLAEGGALKVEIQSATSRDDKVDARLQIGKAGT